MASWNQNPQAWNTWTLRDTFGQRGTQSPTLGSSHTLEEQPQKVDGSAASLKPPANLGALKVRWGLLGVLGLWEVSCRGGLLLGGSWDLVRVSLAGLIRVTPSYK